MNFCVTRETNSCFMLKLASVACALDHGFLAFVTARVFKAFACYIFAIFAFVAFNLSDFPILAVRAAKVAAHASNGKNKSYIFQT